MFSLLGVIVFVCVLLPIIGIGMVLCGAVTGISAMFDVIGGVLGASLGLVLFVLLVVGVVVGGVMLSLFSLFL